MSTRGDWKAHASKKASTNFISRDRVRVVVVVVAIRAVAVACSCAVAVVFSCARATQIMDKTNDFFFAFFFVAKFCSFVLKRAEGRSCKRYGVKNENAPTAKTSIQNAPSSSSSKEARYKQHATTKAWSGKRLVNRLK